MTQIDAPLTDADRIRAIHRYLLAHTFYPLLLCTVLGFAFHIARIYFTHRFQFLFLIWNLFLAWIPYWLSLAALQLHQEPQPRRAWIAVVWLAWLAMFPNAPYILTDFIHLQDTPPLAWWYDLGLVMTFALAGCFCGIVSLRIMHDILRPRIGIIGGWCFVTTVAALSGLGIYIGRFLRWNSWDILTRPHQLFPDLAERVFNPVAHPRTLGVTLMFGAMMLAMYVMFVSMQPRRVDC
jgi:uncharacterized membrane protein